MTFAVADFHNHSCLSPCGSLDLSPRVLVEKAKARGITVLALSDHNSARNTPAFESLAVDAGILPLSGIEVTTQEELHCLCLFATSAQALDFGERIESHLVKIRNQPEKWGDQVIVDRDEEVLGEIPYWLGAPTDIPLTQLSDWCLSADGLFIPAHIDRPSQSVLSQLGYLPDLPYSALEVRTGPAGLQTRGKSLVKGSDAHFADDVGKRTCQLSLTRIDFSEVRYALENGLVS